MVWSGVWLVWKHRWKFWYHERLRISWSLERLSASQKKTAFGWVTQTCLHNKTGTARCELRLWICVNVCVSGTWSEVIKRKPVKHVRVLAVSFPWPFRYLRGRTVYVIFIAAALHLAVKYSRHKKLTVYVYLHAIHGSFIQRVKYFLKSMICVYGHHASLLCENITWKDSAVTSLHLAEESKDKKVKFALKQAMKAQRGTEI